MYKIKFIKNPPTLENLKLLYESELYQNILKEFVKYSMQELDERELNSTTLAVLLNYIKRLYLILNIPFEEVLSEFESNKDKLLKYWLVSADFFIKNKDENPDGEFPEDEEPDEDDKSVVLKTFGICPTALLNIFCEFYLLKTGDKERLLHFLKTTRIPFAKKYAKDLDTIYIKVK